MGEISGTKSAGFTGLVGFTGFVGLSGLLGLVDGLATCGTSGSGGSLATGSIMIGSVCTARDTCFSRFSFSTLTLTISIIR